MKYPMFVKLDTFWLGNGRGRSGSALVPGRAAAHKGGVIGRLGAAAKTNIDGKLAALEAEERLTRQEEITAEGVELAAATRLRRTDR